MLFRLIMISIQRVNIEKSLYALLNPQTVIQPVKDIETSGVGFKDFILKYLMKSIKHASFENRLFGMANVPMLKVN